MVTAHALRPSAAAVPGRGLPERLATTPILMGVPVAVDLVTGSSLLQAAIVASINPASANPTDPRTRARWKRIMFISSGSFAIDISGLTGLGLRSRPSICGYGACRHVVLE